jgi:hypothetical protein
MSEQGNACLFGARGQPACLIESRRVVEELLEQSRVSPCPAKHQQGGEDKGYEQEGEMCS